MTHRSTLGTLVSLIGAALGIVGSLLIFVRIYFPMIALENAVGRPDEGIIVKYIFPALNDVSILGGVLWALAAFAFYKGLHWAWHLGVIANVIALQGSFFTMIPPLSRGESPLMAVVFIPNLIFFFLLLRVVRQVDWRVVWFTLFAGMTFVLCFMNGVASMNKIMVTEDLTHRALFVGVQQLNWIASIAWGVCVIAMIFGKPWSKYVGLGAALMGLVGGGPLAVLNTIEANQISMFTPGPALGLVLAAILLLVSIDPWLSREGAAGAVELRDAGHTA